MFHASTENKPINFLPFWGAQRLTGAPGSRYNWLRWIEIAHDSSWWLPQAGIEVDPMQKLALSRGAYVCWGCELKEWMV